MHPVSKTLLLPCLAATTLMGCAPSTVANANSQSNKGVEIATEMVATKFKPSANPKLERAIFAGGCFWGTEFHFREVPGVTKTAVGYIGGKTKNPTYMEICYEDTGHAEALMLEFDANQISYEKLVDVFWATHNPCTLNRQGPDRGTQYRSEIFYLNENQRKIAEKSMKRAQANFKRPIVTKITPAPTFYFAENYHQQYAAKNGKASCPIDFSDHKKIDKS